MTLLATPRVRVVGVRELHDRLSHYLRHVADGGEVIVTSRGKRVARLSAVDAVDPLEDLRRRGLIAESAMPKEPAGKVPKVEAHASVADLVAEQRR